MQQKWCYKKFDIEEGLKPGSATFRYFFVVSENGAKKCNYCVWIVDEALPRFDPAGDFNAIVASQRENWRKWVEEKIDAADFRNRALRIDPKGQAEINLSEMKQHVKMS